MDARRAAGRRRGPVGRASRAGSRRSGADRRTAVPPAPVTAEHRYRLSAAIRPFLFWVGAKNVGGARIVWRHDGAGRKGYELLLGSDPARAPRRINRWGWVREDADASGATMIGVMNRSEDDSPGPGQGRASAAARAATSSSSTARASRTAPPGPRRRRSTRRRTTRSASSASCCDSRTRRSRRRASERAGCPRGRTPGLLFALADLVRAGVEAARAPGSAGPRHARCSTPSTPGSTT